MPKPILPDALILPAGDAVLRDWRDDDASSLRSVAGDPEVCRFTTVPRTYTHGSARDWIERQRAHRRAGTGVVLAIARSLGGPPVGTVNLVRFSADGKQAVLGYWLVPSARGEGLATSAARALADWGFHQLGLRRIELAILPDNAASQRVADRLGAKHEGCRRASHHADGRDWDMLIYALRPT